MVMLENTRRPTPWKYDSSLPVPKYYHLVGTGDCWTTLCGYPADLNLIGDQYTPNRDVCPVCLDAEPVDVDMPPCW